MKNFNYLETQVVELQYRQWNALSTINTFKMYPEVVYRAW